MPYRKNVFLIGAGASVHEGAPTMASFLDRATELLHTGRLSDDEAVRFKRVLDYRTAHDVAEQRGNLDLTNIEDLFGLVDVHGLLDPAEFGDLRRDMVFLVLRTLEKVINPGDKGSRKIQLVDGDGYGLGTTMTSEHFVDLVAGRYRGGSKDSIISLNYDLVLEAATDGRFPNLDYGLEDTKNDSDYGGAPKLKLLKLHGSASWGICPRCQLVNAKLRMPVSQLESVRCSNQECEGEPLEPLIVPPTWSKGQYAKPLQKVWQSAYHELQTAGRLVLVGTSLPKTDLFLRYFLGLALQRNKALDRILLINPDQNPYGELFSKLPSRIKLQEPLGALESALSKRGLQISLGQLFKKTEPSW